MSGYEDIVCPNCDLSQEDWSGSNGKGYRKGMQTFCCDKCALNEGCMCLERDDVSSPN